MGELDRSVIVNERFRCALNLSELWAQELWTMNRNSLLNCKARNRQTKLTGSNRELIRSSVDRATLALLPQNQRRLCAPIADLELPSNYSLICL
jgi:hypothetical protein